MSSFLYELGRTAFRKRWTFIGIWLAVLVLFGALGGLLMKPFDDNFTLPGSEGQEAMDSLSLTFPQVSGSSASIIVVAAEGDDVTAAPYRGVIEDTVDELEEYDHVSAVTSPFSEMVSGNLSDDDRAAIINVQYDLATADLPDTVAPDLQDAADAMLAELPAGTEISPGGDIFQVTGVHISWVEAVGVLIAFIVLFFTFGSMLAAGIPLVTAIVGVGIGMTLILLSTAVATVNSTTPMLALMLGLAVGIDYALFIVSRARQIMTEGHDAEEAVARAVATSGSAVVFAGVTVIIALVGLGVAEIPFLTVMGVAAAVTVAIAVMLALTMLPALLGLMGERLRPKAKRTRTKAAEAPAPEAQAAGSAAAAPAAAKPSLAQRFFGGWEAIATKVPALTVVIIVVGLGLFAFPASRLELALPNNGSAEEGSPARETYDLTAEYFGPGFNGPLVMTVDILNSSDPLGDMDKVKEDVLDVDGVKTVLLATPNENADTGIVQIVPEFAPDDPRTTEVVHELRDLEQHFSDDYGFSTAVTGNTAMAIDVSSQLGKALLPFGIFVVGLSFVLLMMVFRSVAVPIKATVGYLLSVVTAFGAVVLVFQDGFLADAIGIEQTGPLISFLPIILMGILFGLAMDYEVFLVSGMREAYVHGADAKTAIRRGFTNSANVVTAAAVIMFSVFFAFVPTGEAIIKSIALALAVGIFVDAFIVRMTLVPAVMALLGDKAWWLPKWLDRVMPHFDVEGEGLFHQVALKDWPEPNSPYVVYGEGMGLHTASRAVFENVDVAVKPGEALAVTGRGAGALLLALTGRAGLDSGELKIGEYVMPEQAVKVRLRTPLVMLNPKEDELAVPESVLRDLAANPPELLVIDHADQPRTHEVADLVKDLVAAALDAGSAVVLGLTTEDADWMLPPGTPYSLLDLDSRAESAGSARARSAESGNTEDVPTQPLAAPLTTLGGQH
ncbi:MMPL family transporter [Brevibacterium samyangense]|uniref:MMPL family transporter n=1 Tax=Brevibacterium samyangense TaxID=366888 RepID=A0ABN2T5R9_9MICO